MDWTADGALARHWLAEGKIFKAHLDVTYRCDLACKHCYLDDRTTWPELTGAEWRSVLDQLAALGALGLRWSGGDPSQRADFDELLAYARSLGFHSSVRTHGGFLTPERCAFLVAQWVTKVTVSLYSLRADFHDAFTRHPGSWQGTVNGIEAALAAGLEVGIDVVLQPDTIAEIPALAAWGRARGAVVRFQDTVARDHAGSAALDALMLSAEQVQAARRLIAALPKADAPLPPTITQRPGSVPCYAGRNSVYITPDGAVWPCVTWPMSLGHLKEQPLAQIWHESPLRKEILAWTNDSRSACQGCAGSGQCFYCAGEAYKLTGDYRTAPAEFHARTRARLVALEETGRLALNPAEWASVPDVEPVRPPVVDQPQKMYRPSRGRGVRVQQVALSQTKIGQS